MGKQIHFELTEKKENMWMNVKRQFERDFDSTNNGSFATKARYFDTVGDRFGKYIAVHNRLQNVENISAKHIYGYVDFLQANGKSPAYIYTEMSAIRYWRKHSRCKNALPTNKKLNLEKRQVGKFNRSFLDCEIKDMLALAEGMGRKDIVSGIELALHFGLRKNELVTLRVYQLENALELKQLHIEKGKAKGGQARDIPLDTKEQFEVLKRVLDHAYKEGKKSADYVFCDNHKNSVLKKKTAMTDWMSNHIDKILASDRKNQIKEGKKDRADSGYGWHALRHTYAQRTEEMLISRGMSADRARQEVSERLGHHRREVLKNYEE